MWTLPALSGLNPLSTHHLLHQTLIRLSQLSLVSTVAVPGAYGTFSGCWNGFSMFDQVLIHKGNVVCFDLCRSWNEMWLELFCWLTLTFAILVLYLQFVNFHRRKTALVLSWKSLSVSDGLNYMWGIREIKYPHLVLHQDTKPNKCI